MVDHTAIMKKDKLLSCLKDIIKLVEEECAADQESMTKGCTPDLKTAPCPPEAMVGMLYEDN